MQAVLTTLDCGYMMDEATQFADERSRYCVAIRGENESGEKLAPLIMSALGEVQKTKRKFYRVGTRTAKNTMARRLRIEAPSPGHVTFPAGLVDAHPDYYKGLFAERRVRDRKGIERWERISKANTGEPWDTLLGNLVAIRLAAARYPKVERLLRAPERYEPPEPWDGEDRSDMAVVHQERLLRSGTRDRSDQVRIPRPEVYAPPPPPRQTRHPIAVRSTFGGMR
jgi:phage terminase large subunit GpA-like protein